MSSKDIKKKKTKKLSSFASLSPEAQLRSIRKNSKTLVRVCQNRSKEYRDQASRKRSQSLFNKPWSEEVKRKFNERRKLRKKLLEMHLVKIVERKKICGVQKMD